MNRAADQIPDAPIDQPVLQTQRLILRAFTLDDAAAVNELLADKEIAANTQLIPYPYTVEMARQWIEPQLKTWQEGRAAVFAVCLAGTVQWEHETLIGVVGLEIDSAHERAELGYWVGKTYWDSGYCTEAAAAVVEFGFTRLGLNRVFAYHLLRNPASGRVMQKLGMKQEGVLQQHVKKWGMFEDVALYGTVCRSRESRK